MGFVLPDDALSYADAPSSSGGGFVSGVNDILGAVNALGTTAINIRDRFTRSGAGAGEYGVPVSGKPADSIAASRQENQPTSWSVPKMLLAFGGLALVIGVVVKLAKR